MIACMYVCARRAVCAGEADRGRGGSTEGRKELQNHMGRMRRNKTRRERETKVAGLEEGRRERTSEQGGGNEKKACCRVMGLRNGVNVRVCVWGRCICVCGTRVEGQAEVRGWKKGRRKRARRREGSGERKTEKEDE